VGTHQLKSERASHQLGHSRCQSLDVSAISRTGYSLKKNLAFQAKKSFEVMRILENELKPGGTTGT
jgi:hypothetical protein